MWAELIRLFWQICTFKNTPAELPYSPILLVIVSLVFLFSVVLQWMLSNLSGHLNYLEVIMVGCLLIFSYAAYTGLLLYIYRRFSRMVQTLTALLACHTLVHVMALPLLLAMPFIKGLDKTSLLAFIFNVIFLIMSLMLSVWQFMITAHIYKHALSIKAPASFLASLGLLAFNILMVSFW